MDKKRWLFIFAALSGLGGLACILQWLGIKPQDLWGFPVLTAPHWVWFVFSVILFVASFALSIYGMFYQRPGKLVIHRAVYGAGPQADVDVTDFLRKATRDALVIPVDNKLVPTDPAIGIRKRLVVDYSYDDGVVYSAVGMESARDDMVRLVLPESSEIQALKREVSYLRSKNSDKSVTENNDIPLVDKLTNLTKDILKFIQEQGPSPEPMTKESEIFIHKVHSRFSLRLYDHVEKIILELGEQGIFDYSLNALIQKDKAISEKSVRQIAEKLQSLRDRVELKGYGIEALTPRKP